MSSRYKISFIVFIALSLFIMYSRLASCAEESLSILGVDLHLQMEKKVVFPQFRDYRIQCVDSSLLAPDCNGWLIQSASPPYETYANLSFSEGRLVTVLKYWDKAYEGSDPSKFFEALHSILSQYASRGNIKFDVHTVETKESGVTQKAIFLTLGKKTIWISYADGLRDSDGNKIFKFVNINELLK
jgi:hypothetical protein